MPNSDVKLSDTLELIAVPLPPHVGTPVSRFSDDLAPQVGEIHEHFLNMESWELLGHQS